MGDVEERACVPVSLRQRLMREVRHLRTLVSYGQIVDSALVDVLLRAGIDALAAAPEYAAATASTAEVDAAVLGVWRERDIEVIRGVRRAVPECAILAIADGIDDRTLLVDALIAGADGFAFPRRPEDIVKPLRLLLQGEAVFPRAFTEVLADVVAYRGVGVLSRTHRQLRLSARESSVCYGLERGLATKAIAQELGVSAVTARRHITSAMHKAGANDRQELLDVLLDRTRQVRESAAAG